MVDAVGVAFAWHCNVVVMGVSGSESKR
jgi:hypothetical protein